MAFRRGAGLFPLPQITVSTPCSSRSRRIQQRSRRNVAAAHLTNNAITALNKLHSSYNSRFPTRNYSPNFSKHTLRAVSHVKTCAQRFVSRIAPSFSTASRDDISSLQDTCDLTSATYANNTNSLPLDANHVSLPNEPGGVDLLSVFPPDLAQRYASPDPSLFRAESDRPQARSVRLVKSDGDYARIITRMSTLGMVTFTTTPIVVNGVFATPKSNGAQRLVVDGRPVNAVFEPSPKVELPTPDLLSKLETRPDQKFFVAKADLDNYYHRLKVPTWMHPYFALPKVRAGAVGQGATFGHDTFIYPCCTTLPMGWSHAAFLAQEAHEHIVNTKTSLSPRDRIERHRDAQLNRTRHMIYIDDCMMLGLDPDEIRRLQVEYARVMEEVGLPTKPSKEVLPSANGVECLGLWVHGTDMTTGVHPDKLHRLTLRTQSLINVGQCTGEDLARIVGHWSWAFLARRSAFSIFNAVYRFIEVAGKKRFDIWPTVARELTMAADLSILLFALLDAPWADTTVATDACMTGIGVTAAQCAEVDLQQLALLPVPNFNIPSEVDRTPRCHRYLRVHNGEQSFPVVGIIPNTSTFWNFELWTLVSVG